MSSFQQLLASQDVDKQERLSKFQQLLASQDLDQDGAPLSGLAGRVQSMAAQLNALQKRTQVTPLLISKYNSKIPKSSSELRRLHVLHSPA